MKIIIINGPNLNLLGKRNPEIYGNQGFGTYIEHLKKLFEGTEFVYFQSNHEGELIDKLHEFGFNHTPIILNAGGFTHTSVALADAVEAIESPVYEVHISNIYARESYRQKSLISPHAKAVVAGMGLEGYEYAIRKILS